MAHPDPDPGLRLVQGRGTDSREAPPMTFPSASAGESLERVLCLIEKLEFHQRRMEDILSAILDLSEPGDDLAVECRRLLACLRSE